MTGGSKGGPTVSCTRVSRGCSVNLKTTAVTPLTVAAMHSMPMAMPARWLCVASSNDKDLRNETKPELGVLSICVGFCADKDNDHKCTFPNAHSTAHQMPIWANNLAFLRRITRRVVCFQGGLEGGTIAACSFIARGAFCSGSQRITRSSWPQQQLYDGLPRTNSLATVPASRYLFAP